MNQSIFNSSIVAHEDYYRYKEIDQKHTGRKTFSMNDKLIEQFVWNRKNLKYKEVSVC